MWMMLLLAACELGLEPWCCPPDKERPSPAPTRPEGDVMDTGNWAQDNDSGLSGFYAI